MLIQSAKRLGIDVNSVPDMSNADVRSALRQSIVSVEQGIPYEKVADYLTGNTGQNPGLVDASGKVLATGGADPNPTPSSVRQSGGGTIGRGREGDRATVVVQQNCIGQPEQAGRDTCKA